jgi:hypothetical protein
MRIPDIIEAMLSKLTLPGGRHLYAILGNYRDLDHFAKKLQQAKTADGKRFPAPLNVNRGILDAIPDDEFRQLVENEAKRPEPTASHVAKAFEAFLRSQLGKTKLVVLAHLEMLFAYNLELNLLRTLAADEHRILLLLPGKRMGGRIAMFPAQEDAAYMLPTNLVADNHMWEITE